MTLKKVKLHNSKHLGTSLVAQWIGDHLQGGAMQGVKVRSWPRRIPHAGKQRLISPCATTTEPGLLSLLAEAGRAWVKQQRPSAAKNK